MKNSFDGFLGYRFYTTAGIVFLLHDLLLSSGNNGN